METKLSTLKNLKTLTLTSEERDLMRAHAARIVMTTPVVVTESFFKRGVQHGLRIALSSMMFVVFIAGSVSAVASNALPGDPLYSFKINVNEEVKGLFLKTPEEKVLWQKNRIENRVSEIQILAESNSLTQAKQQTAEKAINSHVAALSTDLTTLSDQSPNTALTVTTSLEQTLKANKTSIQNSSDSADKTDTGKADAIKTVDATLLKVSNQEVQILSKEIDNINTAVTTVPTDATAALKTTTTTDTAGTSTSTSVNAKTVTPSTP
ncbi:MAG: hypothetical protein JWL92_316 [Candidatus Nomurabacteria bacterium]|nr:hypothetical protein [Candidatus Nomurabacteria bacterium]